MMLRRALAATVFGILVAGSSAWAQDGAASPRSSVQPRLHPRIHSNVRLHLHQMSPRIHARASFKHLMRGMRAKTREFQRMQVAESRLMRSQMRVQMRMPMRELRRTRIAPMRLHRNGSSREI